MSRSIPQIYGRRIETLKRRRDFLDKRIADYHGKNMSRDKAEVSAIDWALKVIENNPEKSMELIEAKS